MKTVWVTGAAGYIGQHVIKELLDNGDRVIATDINIANIDNRAQVFQYDIREKCDFLSQTKLPDVLLHLAWQDGFIHHSERQLQQIPIHYNFLKAAIDSGVKHVAVLGTMHEIGYYEGCASENVACNPINLYGIAKDTLRRAIFLLEEKCDLTIQWLRAFYIYGNDLYNKSVFSKILLAEQQGIKMFPFTSGRSEYDFIHIQLLTEQIIACIHQSKVNGIINCCSGSPMSLMDKAEQFIEANHLDIKLDYGAYPERKYDSPAIWGDNEKVQDILNGNR